MNWIIIILLLANCNIGRGSSCNNCRNNIKRTKENINYQQPVRCSNTCSERYDNIPDGIPRRWKEYVPQGCDSIVSDDGKCPCENS